MATTTSAFSTAPSRQVGSHDRIFYSTMAIVLALTVLLGFGPTYYFKLVGSAPMATISGAPFSKLVYVHGALFTAWVLLFIVQTALVATHRVAVHRRLGIAGAILALAMVIVGITTAITATARGTAPPGINPLSFLAIPLGDMLLFSTFVASALYLRKNKEAHKRLMLLAYISILVAALARLPGILQRGPLAFFGLACIFLAAAAIYDWVSRGRIHPAYIWGGSAFVLSVPLRLALSGTEAWKNFARMLIS
jgi:hypothetical protein